MQYDQNYNLRVEAENIPAQLPFDSDQQSALLGHILLNESFFRQMYGKLQANWFMDPAVAKLYGFYVNFYKYYDHAPRSEEEFKQWSEFRALDQGDKIRLYNKLSSCRLKTETHGVTSLADQLTQWSKTQVFLRNLPQIANLINSRQLVKAEDLFQETAKTLVFSSFQDEAAFQWKNYRAIRDTAEADLSGAMSTGLTLLDRKLLPHGSKGSLLPGDTTLIVAPVNVGKTTTMLSMVRHNIFAGKSVLLITREGRDNDIGEKMFCSCFRKSKSELWAWSRTPEGEAAFDKMAEFLSQQLTYLHLPKVDQFVEDVISDVFRLQAARKAKYGKGYDLLVVDYPGIFQSRETQGAKWQYRQIQDYIYRQFVQVGAEQKLHVIAAVQANREASKINKGLSVRRLLVEEDIQEAWGIAQSATNIITLNRDAKAQDGKYMTFYLVKSRSSEVGWAITARTDFAKALTHGDELGATAYRGNVALNDQIDDLLRRYPNRDIPEGMIDGYKINLHEEESK